jgi:hypothetical protein
MLRFEMLQVDAVEAHHSHLFGITLLLLSQDLSLQVVDFNLVHPSLFNLLNHLLDAFHATLQIFE